MHIFNSGEVEVLAPDERRERVKEFGAGGAIVFKGTGLYQTDYRSDSYKKSAAADKPSGGDSSSSSA